MRWLLFLLAGCGFRGPTATATSGDDATDIDAAHIDPDATPTSDGASLPDAPSLDAFVTAAPLALTGARWLQPCSMDHTPNATACHCAPQTQTLTLVSGGGAHWHVAARIRGVMERMAYAGGTLVGGCYVGGVPGNTADNFYELAISSPAAHFYLNPGTGNGNHSWAVDYTVAFDMDAGAIATFTSNGQDNIQWMGVDAMANPISVAGVTDPIQPYDGQWARIDVTGATPF